MLFGLDKLAATVNGGVIYTSSNYGITWHNQRARHKLEFHRFVRRCTKLAAVVNNTTSGGIYVSQAFAMADNVEPVAISLATEVGGGIAVYRTVSSSPGQFRGKSFGAF